MASVLVFASIFSGFFQEMSDEGRLPIFLVLAGFLLSFILIRISTRLMRSDRVPWWPGSIVSDSGVHLHHLVFGIVTMMLSGAIAFVSTGDSPWFEVMAFGFGVGVGLTIDEFALWVHLEDVYWAEEGRRSIDATVIAVLVGSIFLFGVQPFNIDTASPGVLVISIVILAIDAATIAICFLKDRFLHGIVTLFFWPIGWYAVCRLGKPKSRWAKKRYGKKNPSKQVRAELRFRPDRRTERFKEKFRDVVGGGIGS